MHPLTLRLRAQTLVSLGSHLLSLAFRRKLPAGAEPGRAYLQGAIELSLRRAYKLDWTALSEPSLGDEAKRAEPNRAYYASRDKPMQAYLSRLREEQLATLP